MENTIEVVGVDTLRMPYTWSITLSFTSRNAGYGDRTNDMLATVLTPHTMVIVVSQGEVISALTDDIFNELTETMMNTYGTLSEAETIAMNWLKDSPTFSFDGVDGSMMVVDSVIAESYPVQYFLTITFQCTHAGYGDRTGEMLAQVITEHKAAIKVVNGEIESAVIDSVWDELNQVDNTVSSDILAPEGAVNIVIQYLRENYPEAESLVMDGEWTVANLTPEGLLGYSTMEYSGDGWTIKISYPVVWKPTYEVDVVNTSGFHWAGSVDQSGKVTELTE